MSRMTIKNGGFAVDGAPVFLIGACASVGAHGVGKDNHVTSLKAAKFGDVGFNALEECWSDGTGWKRTRER